MTIQDQIKNARKAAGMTQVQLAELSGIRQATISDIERGRGNPELSTLEAICKILKCNIGITFENKCK